MNIIPPAARPEWRDGWKTVVGASICGGTGAGLVFFMTSLFVPSMEQEFGVSRGDMSNAQALVAIGGFLAPLTGNLLDRHGFRIIYGWSAAIIAMTSLGMALWVNSYIAFAFAALIYGIFGLATGPLGYTRPVNAEFHFGRGLALGMAALGLAVTTILVPPLVATVIESFGWRSGYLLLAAITGLIGLPLTLWLVRSRPARDMAAHPAAPAPVAPKASFSFMREADFWKIALSYLFMAIPGAGFIAALAPMIAEEGVPLTLAASAISLFAAGQVAGRLASGWWLDRGVPQRVAFTFTIVPALGFLLLAGLNGGTAIALLAAFLIGIQQGSETDLVAYHVARRFGMGRYASIYGWVLSLAWIGNAIGVIGFGQIHDIFGNYSIAQGAGALSFAVAALLMLSVTLPPLEPAEAGPD